MMKHNVSPKIQRSVESVASVENLVLLLQRTVVSFVQLKNLVLLLVLFHCSSFCFSAKASPSSAPSSAVKTQAINTQEAAKLKSLLAPLESLTANFYQALSNEKGVTLHESKGKMWLKKPGQFRWEVQDKDPRLVVSNGKQVWDYDKDLEQVTIQKLSKAEAKAPIFFLTGDVNGLEKDFKISEFSATAKPCMKEGSEECFELQPKTEHSAFQIIRVGFKNKVLHELDMIDQLGQRSFIKFTEAKVNTPISPNLFQFVIPKGVDVVEQKI